MTELLPLDTSSQPLRLRAADFLLLSDSGAFANYARTELIEGEIWVVNAIHSRHARVHSALTVALGTALEAMSSPLVLYIAPSTALSDESMPEPDIALADPNDAAILPGEAVRLAIEIADATLANDMGRKARLYATARIFEYWVVDVEARVIHQLWSPSGDAYAQRRKIIFGDVIASATIEGMSIATESL